MVSKIRTLLVLSSLALTAAANALTVYLSVNGGADDYTIEIYRNGVNYPIGTITTNIPQGGKYVIFYGMPTGAYFAKVTKKHNSVVQFLPTQYAWSYWSTMYLGQVNFG